MLGWIVTILRNRGANLLLFSFRSHSQFWMSFLCIFLTSNYRIFLLKSSLSLGSPLIGRVYSYTCQQDLLCPLTCLSPHYPAFVVMYIMWPLGSSGGSLPSSLKHFPVFHTKLNKFQSYTKKPPVKLRQNPEMFLLLWIDGIKPSSSEMFPTGLFLSFISPPHRNYTRRKSLQQFHTVEIDAFLI